MRIASLFLSICSDRRSHIVAYLHHKNTSNFAAIYSFTSLFCERGMVTLIFILSHLNSKRTPTVQTFLRPPFSSGFRYLHRQSIQQRLVPTYKITITAKIIKITLASACFAYTCSRTTKNV